MTRKIAIIGLGPGSLDSLTLVTYKKLKECKKIFLRTEKHPVVNELKELGFSFHTFDYLYEREDNFKVIYEKIAQKIVGEALQGEVVYGVPGHPLVAEESVNLIMAKARSEGIDIEFFPAVSFLDSLFTALKVDPSQGLLVLDGLMLVNEEQFPNPGIDTVISQVYSKMVASDIKLTLMDYYPDEYNIKVIRAAGIKDEERIGEIPLYELDRLTWIDHLTSIFIPSMGSPQKCQYPLDPLVDIMALLRSENGCPWDREQTHHSLKKYLLEETYEVLDAIEQENMYKVSEELGDLLLQVVFHSQIAAEEGIFDINDVIDCITKKMIRRHPHVFGEVKVESSKEVKINWERIKEQEKGQKQSLLEGIPLSLPAVLRAYELQARAAKVGFDWPDYTGALQKVYEELEECEAAIKKGDDKNLEEEIGDLLFALVNLSRLLDIDPESALAGTNNKFIKRFNYIEEKALETGKNLQDMLLKEMDKLWEESKKINP